MAEVTYGSCAISSARARALVSSNSRPIGLRKDVLDDLPCASALHVGCVCDSECIWFMYATDRSKNLALTIVARRTGGVTLAMYMYTTNVAPHNSNDNNSNQRADRILRFNRVLYCR